MQKGRKSCENNFITKNNEKDEKDENYSIAETMDVGGRASEPDK